MSDFHDIPANPDSPADRLAPAELEQTGAVEARDLHEICERVRHIEEQVGYLVAQIAGNFASSKPQ